MYPFQEHRRKMKRLIFTLTGISLLDEDKELLGKGRVFKDNLGEIKKRGNIEAIITNNEVLEERKEPVLNALKNKKLRDELAGFSAEIASLHKLKAVDNKDDKIIFIVTQTPECTFAGIVNGKFIIYKRTKNQQWGSITFDTPTSDGAFSCNNVEIKIIKGLQVTDAEKFRTKGIKNLFDFVSTRMNEEGNLYDEIIFNITGGYKGTIPYFTLFGMLYQESELNSKGRKVSIKYLYEKSEEIITLPNLPIAFDIFTWRNYRGFIKTIPHLGTDVAKVFLDNILPAQISGLFEEVNDKYMLTKLGEILEGRYDDEKEGELTPYGRGYLLLDKINDEQKHKALQDCINRWQYLWLGDLIPETVEHARGHTQRDLELAAQILYPILNEEEDFFGDKYLTDNNLLALISAIWLHDLGHSGDHLKCANKNGIIKDGNQIKRDIKGFPSQVRDMHHLLSWYLIGKDRKELFESNSVFDDDLIEAIRQVCLYHRGKMPALDNHKPFEHIGIEIKEPLEKLNKDRVNRPLLGALLRIVDEGDVQRERTISEEYEAMRILQNNREIERLKKDEKRFREIVMAVFNGNQKPSLPEYLKFTMEVAEKYFSNANAAAFELNNYFRKLTKISDKKCDKLKSLQETDVDEKYRDEYLDHVVDGCVRNFVQEETLDSIDTGGWLLLRNWLSALNQFIFKKRQPSHFDKHKGISAVMYLLDKPDEENGKNKYHFKVLAIHKKGENEVESKKIIQNVEQVVLKDIHNEYEMVKEILNEHRIFFDSYYKMEEGSEEMVPVTFESSKNFIDRGV